MVSCAGDYFDPMFVKPMVALRPLHYSAEVNPNLSVQPFRAAAPAGKPPSNVPDCTTAGSNNKGLFVAHAALFCMLLVAVQCCLWPCQGWGCFSTTMMYAAAEQVSAPTDGVFGCGAHSDYGMLTILATDSVPGLQVRGVARHVHAKAVSLFFPDDAKQTQHALLRTCFSMQ